MIRRPFALAISLLIAGCSSGVSPSPTPEPTPTAAPTPAAVWAVADEAEYDLALCEAVNAFSRAHVSLREVKTSGPEDISPLLDKAETQVEAGLAAVALTKNWPHQSVSEITDGVETLNGILWNGDAPTTSRSALAQLVESVGLSMAGTIGLYRDALGTGSGSAADADNFNDKSILGWVLATVSVARDQGLDLGLSADKVAPSPGEELPCGAE